MPVPGFWAGVASTVLSSLIELITWAPFAASLEARLAPAGYALAENPGGLANGWIATSLAARRLPYGLRPRLGMLSGAWVSLCLAVVAVLLLDILSPGFWPPPEDEEVGELTGRELARLSLHSLWICALPFLVRRR